MSKSNPRRILLQVSGSIAAFKAVALCSKLVQIGHEVEVILSEGAERFVGAASFEGLTRRKVHQGLYDEGKMMAHIDLERWADLVLLYPASANVLATLATGRSDSLIGALFLAHEFKKPYWIIPAMNQAMWDHPATQANVAALRSFGVVIETPESGSLACGEIGSGRLVEPETMLEKIRARFTNPNALKILVTSGGTSEPIDSVRSITNFSTGQTGFSVAKAFAEQGHDVTLIQSSLSKFQPDFHPPIRTLNYVTTDEFSKVVKQELESSSFDYLIHAAAVADFKIEKFEGKLSSNQPIQLNLVPNQKVIRSVRKWSKNKNLKLISFKLTAANSADPALDGYDSEWVIHNELKNVNGQNHSGVIYTKSNSAIRYKKLNTFQSKKELTQQLIHLVTKENT